jgi:hypothetical protein
VCAVSDGAEWIQGFVDFHRPDAVRILDFPHALGYVAQVGQAVYGEGTAAFKRWFATQRHTLQHGNPEVVLGALRRLEATAQRRQAAVAAATVQASVHYLEKRRSLLAYAWYQARGYPIGSGSVESANKRVVERRLKGAGRHWARVHVNPMVALCAMACSDRWREAWPQIAQQVRQQTQQSRWQRQLTRRQVKTALLGATPPPTQPGVLATAPTAGPQPVRWRSPSPKPTVPTRVKAPYRPPPDHPWRGFPITWKSTQQTKIATCAKL